jgi:CheY-like chemotaxis protein
MVQKRVLVADDLASVLTAVAELLNGSFHVVRMVSDGTSALGGILERHGPRDTVNSNAALRQSIASA